MMMTWFSVVLRNDSGVTASDARLYVCVPSDVENVYDLNNQFHFSRL